MKSGIAVSMLLAFGIGCGDDVGGGSPDGSDGTGAAGGAGGASGQGGSGGSGGTGGSGGMPDASGGSGGLPGGTGGTGGSGGTGGAGGAPCNPPPAGLAARRFDLAYYFCGAGQPSCSAPLPMCPADPGQAQCFCDAELTGLDYGPPHFLLVTSDRHKCAIWAAGNYLANYVNAMNAGFAAGRTGAQAADDLVAAAGQSFANAPEWFFLNEISTSQWPASAAYRDYVVALAARLHGTYQKQVIVASPFATVGTANTASWQALAQHAFIGIENYVSGAEINASGNSVAFCAGRYQASIDSYTSPTHGGVARARLMLVEHFANTCAGTGRGQDGVSDTGWRNAITARSQAAHQLGFAGFISYAWVYDELNLDEPTRLSFMSTYAAQSLP